MTTPEAMTRVTSYIVDDRDGLLLMADFSPLFSEMSAHFQRYDLNYDVLLEQLLRDGLVALSMHLLTRPGDEKVGWTISIQQPRLNLFFVGESGDGRVVGRPFEGGVEPRDENLFVSQVVRQHGQQHQSTLDVEGVDIFAMVEEFYRRSEQKEGRFFHDGPRVALLQALPGEDEQWVKRVAAEEVFALPDKESTRHLCERTVHLYCGCDLAKILSVVSSTYGTDQEDLFGEDDAVEIECPRCGRRYFLGRQEYQEYLDEET